MRQSEGLCVAAVDVLLGFKYRSTEHPGICRRLEVARESIAAGGADWHPSGVHASGGGVSDPTASAALGGRAGVARLERQAREYEREIAEVGMALRRVRHGDALDLYYLDADGVTWGDVAGELGCGLSTVFRWRDAALEELDERGLL